MNSKETNDSPKEIRLVLNPKTTEMVERMMRLGELSKYPQLCNIALTILHWATDMAMRGYKIAAYDESERKFRIVNLEYFDNVAKNRSNEVIGEAEKIVLEEFLKPDSEENLPNS